MWPVHSKWSARCGYEFWFLTKCCFNIASGTKLLHDPADSEFRAGEHFDPQMCEQFCSGRHRRLSQNDNVSQTPRSFNCVGNGPRVGHLVATQKMRPRTVDQRELYAHADPHPSGSLSGIPTST